MNSKIRSLDSASRGMRDGAGRRWRRRIRRRWRLSRRPFGTRRSSRYPARNSRRRAWNRAWLLPPAERFARCNKAKGPTMRSPRGDRSQRGEMNSQRRRHRTFAKRQWASVADQRADRPTNPRPRASFSFFFIAPSSSSLLSLSLLQRRLSLLDTPSSSLSRLPHTHSLLHAGTHTCTHETAL